MSVMIVMFMGITLGFILIALMKRLPVDEAPGWEDGEHLEPEALVDGLERVAGSDEVKAVLLREMGFTDLVRISMDPELSAFLCKNPAPLAGGTYLVHFIDRPGRRPVTSRYLTRLRREMRHDKTIMKGLLVTTGSFTHRTREEAEDQAVELVGGSGLLSLLEAHYPEGIGWGPPADAVAADFEDRLGEGEE